MQRTAASAPTKEACVNGHPMTPDNTEIARRQGNFESFVCKTCRQAQNKASREKRDPLEARKRAAENRRASRARLKEEDPARYAAMLSAAAERRKARESETDTEEMKRRWLRITERRQREASIRKNAASWNVTIPEYNSLLEEATLSEDELVRDQNRPSAAWNILKVKGDALPAWEEFSLHLETTVTPCQGSDKFTEYDDPRPGREDESTGRSMPTRSQAAAMCEKCPLLDLCGKFAQRDKPDFGVWGGRAYLGGKPQ